MSEIPRKPSFPLHMIQKLLQKLQYQVQSNVIPVSTGMYSHQKLKQKLMAIPKPQIQDYDDRIFFSVVQDRNLDPRNLGDKCLACMEEYTKKNIQVMCNFCAAIYCTDCISHRKRAHPLNKDPNNKKYNICQRCDTKYLNLQLGHSYIQNKTLLQQAITKTQQALYTAQLNCKNFEQKQAKTKSQIQKNRMKISQLRKQKLDLSKSISTKAPQQLRKVQQQNTLLKIKFVQIHQKHKIYLQYLQQKRQQQEIASQLKLRKQIQQENKRIYQQQQRKIYQQKQRIRRKQQQYQAEQQNKRKRKLSFEKMIQDKRKAQYQLLTGKPKQKKVLNLQQTTNQIVIPQVKQLVTPTQIKIQQDRLIEQQQSQQQFDDYFEFNNHVKEEQTIQKQIQDKSDHQQERKQIQNQSYAQIEYRQLAQPEQDSDFQQRTYTFSQKNKYTYIQPQQIISQQLKDNQQSVDRLIAKDQQQTTFEQTFTFSNSKNLHQQVEDQIQQQKQSFCQQWYMQSSSKAQAPQSISESLQKYQQSPSSTSYTNNKKQQRQPDQISQLDQQEMQNAKYNLIKAARDKAVMQRQSTKTHKMSIFEVDQQDIGGKKCQCQIF